MIANKLKPGDEIRVVAPSRSQAIIWEHAHHNAMDFWKNSGYKLTFSKNCRELDKYQSSSIARLYFSSILRAVSTVFSLLGASGSAFESHFFSKSA